MRILCVAGGSQYRLLDAFLASVASGFRDAGHEVLATDVWSVKEAGAPAGVDLVFSFGAVGGDVRWDAPLLSWLIDNPVWSPDLFTMNASKDGLLVVDATHPAVVSDFLGLSLPAGFLPHGITFDPAMPEPAFDDSERDIDALVAASFDPRQQTPWTTENPTVAATMKMTLRIGNERWNRHMRELDVTDLWRESAAACGLPGVPEGHRLVAPVLCWLDAHLRARRRLACVQALDAAGVRLHLVGLGWEKVEGLQHATVLGVVDHDEIPALVRRSKTVLNVGPPFFNHGWHERIPLAMMHGAVCVTETSDYLSGDATLSSLVPTYDVADLDSIGDVVHAAIADPDRADKTRDAYKTAREHHTWARRGAAILESVEL